MAINEGDLIYILEKPAQDDWWKAKKRAPEAEDEPSGLIPNNYVQEVSITCSKGPSTRCHRCPSFESVKAP